MIRVKDSTERFQSHVAEWKSTTHPTCSYNNGTSIDCWITFVHLALSHLHNRFPVSRERFPSKLILQSILKAYALMSCLMSLSLIQMRTCLKHLFKQVKWIIPFLPNVNLLSIFMSVNVDKVIAWCQVHTYYYVFNWFTCWVLSWLFYYCWFNHYD